MLALTVKVGEEIVIEDGRIVVTLLHVSPGRARVGVVADKKIPVNRGVIQKRIDEERLEKKKRERPCDESSAG